MFVFEIYMNIPQPPHCRQGFIIRPVAPNRRPPVPANRTGLTGYRSEPDKRKFEFKFPRWNGSNRYTGRIYRFTGRFDW